MIISFICKETEKIETVKQGVRSRKLQHSRLITS
jgi:hypothetical protein